MNRKILYKKLDDDETLKLLPLYIWYSSMAPIINVNICDENPTNWPEYKYHKVNTVICDNNQVIIKQTIRKEIKRIENRIKSAGRFFRIGNKVVADKIILNEDLYFPKFQEYPDRHFHFKDWYAVIYHRNLFDKEIFEKTNEFIYNKKEMFVILSSSKDMVDSYELCIEN